MESTTHTRTAIGRMGIAVALLAMLLLPAADRLAMVIEAGGLHTVRLVDVVLLLAGTLSLLALVRTYGWPRLLRPSLHLGIVAAAVLLLVIVNGQTCTECGRESFARPTTVFRGLALLIASHLLFVTYSADQRSRGVLVVASAATAWAVVSTFLLANPQWAGPLLYSETPYLHKPFMSPVQAANFAAVILLLGAGAALTINRPRLLYILVPTLTLAIAQSGSRSGMVLLLLSWAGFIVLFMARQWLVDRGSAHRTAIHLVASALVAAAAIGLVRTPEMARSASFLGLAPRQIATGQPDEYRSRVWRRAIDNWRQESAPAAMAANAVPPVPGATATAAQPAQQSASATPAAPAETGNPSARAARAVPPGASVASAPESPSSAPLPDVDEQAVIAPAESATPPVREAPHNVYLEFLLYGGVPSVATLLVVLGLLALLTLRYAWEMRRSHMFPFAAALMFSVLFVAGINFGNVTLHLSFVWVLFGLATACASGSFRQSAHAPETASPKSSDSVLTHRV